MGMGGIGILYETERPARCVKLPAYIATICADRTTHNFSPHWVHFILTMNNRERIQKRIERDKKRRAAKKALRMTGLDDYHTVFDFEHLWESGIRCGLGVMWKASVQRYEMFLITNVAILYLGLENYSWQKTTGRFCCFSLIERGKKRDIRSTRINERNGQKCLCDYSLVPALQSTLIYDNGATMKGKGITFAENRLRTMLRRFVAQVGVEAALSDAYAYVYDFHGYFDSADHTVLMAIILLLYADAGIIMTVEKLISDFGDRGLGLGSQISQILALVLASAIDHYLKDRAAVGVYERYMDDGVAVLPTKERAVEIAGHVEKIAGMLGLELNRKKTRIVKLSRGFTFLKIRYEITDSGKIVRHISRDGIRRTRARMKAQRRKLDAGQISLENIEMSMEAYFANCDRANSNRTKMSFWVRFHRMFPESAAFYRKKRPRSMIPEALAFREKWERENPGKSRSAMLCAWREHLKEQEENYHGPLQVSFKRIDR